VKTKPQQLRISSLYLMIFKFVGARGISPVHSSKFLWSCQERRLTLNATPKDFLTTGGRVRRKRGALHHASDGRWISRSSPASRLRFQRRLLEKAMNCGVTGACKREIAVSASARLRKPSLERLVKSRNIWKQFDRTPLLPFADERRKTRGATKTAVFRLFLEVISPVAPLTQR
jgi:hypothetical protein